MTLTTSQRLTLVVVAGVLAIVGLQHCGAPDPAVPPDIVKTRDSLAVTKPALQALLDSSDARGRRHADELRELEERERDSRRIADREKQRADDLEQRAGAATSLQKQVALLRGALQARTLENGELRFQLQQKDLRIGVLTADTVRLSRDKAELRKRVAALEELNARTAAALEQSRECTIAFGIRCPSRTATAVTVLVADRVLQIAGK